MFTMPAIHHPAMRADDSPVGPMGGLHLNALNGSSNVLGYSDSSCGYQSQSCVFGGLFGVSLSDNHPYHPQDSGMTFHETTCKIPHYRSTTSSSTSSSSSSSSSTSANTSTSPSSSTTTTTSTKTTSKHRDAMATLRGSEKASPVGPRRRSLDLDTLSSRNCCRNDDRSLSLEELAQGTFSRRSRYVGDVINENDFTSGLDLTALSITEVQISTNEGNANDKDKHGTDRSAHAQKKRRRALTTDAATSERAIRLLEKIKDSKKDHHSNGTSHIKHTRLRNEDNHEEPEDEHHTSSSRTRHHILRHLSDSAQQKQQRDSHRHRDRKLLSRASVD